MVARHQRARAQVNGVVCNLLDLSCYIGKDYELQLVSIIFIITLCCAHTRLPPYYLHICIWTNWAVTTLDVHCFLHRLNNFLFLVDSWCLHDSKASSQYVWLFVELWDWLYPNCLCYMRTSSPSYVMAAWFCKFNTSLLWVKFIFQACLLM
jgi:hypothetical protein